ncbi:copper resistance protein CopC [Geodermatophilus sp. SYSU D01106]
MDSDERTGPARRVLAGVAAVLVGTAALLGIGMPAASAHDALVSATPADGASLGAAPAAVELRFSGDVQELGAELVVTGPDGARVGDGVPSVSGPTVSLPLPGDLPAGTYAATWRIASADGHPVSGTTTFTVTGGAAPGGTTGDGATADGATGHGATPIQGAAAARPVGSGSSTPWLAGGAAAVLVVAAALAAVQLRRRR